MLGAIYPPPICRCSCRFFALEARRWLSIEGAMKPPPNCRVCTLIKTPTGSVHGDGKTANRFCFADGLGRNASASDPAGLSDLPKKTPRTGIEAHRAEALTSDAGDRETNQQDGARSDEESLIDHLNRQLLQRRVSNF
jgi:hypothetical protein